MNDSLPLEPPVYVLSELSEENQRVLNLLCYHKAQYDFYLDTGFWIDKGEVCWLLSRSYDKDERSHLIPNVNSFEFCFQGSHPNWVRQITYFLWPHNFGKAKYKHKLYVFLKNFPYT